MQPRTFGAKKTWDAIDAEVASSLARRAARRAAADRPSSPLDEVAHDLRRARTVVGSVAHAGLDDDGAEVLVTRSLLWCLHVARELEAIEARGLDASGDWTWFEAFAPNATASFHAALDHLLRALATTPEGAAIGAAIDRVLAHFTLALRASAWAA